MNAFKKAIFTLLSFFGDFDECWGCSLVKQVQQNRINVGRLSKEVVIHRLDSGNSVNQFNGSYKIMKKYPRFFLLGRMI